MYVVTTTTYRRDPFSFFSTDRVVERRVHCTPVRPELSEEEVTVLAWVLGVLGAVFTLTWLIALIAGNSGD